MTALEQAVGGLQAVLQLYGGDSEVRVRYDARRGVHHAQLQLCADPQLPGKRTNLFDGWGPSWASALAALWRGDLGVWRWVDPEGWRAEVYPAGRLAGTNPGPAPGQALGRGDG